MSDFYDGSRPQPMHDGVFNMLSGKPMAPREAAMVQAPYSIRPDCHPVFVYGTLKRKHGNHRLIQANLPGSPNFDLGDCTLRGSYYMLGGGFPYLGHDPSLPPVRVAGECYIVDDATLRRMDSLEGHPHHYRRTIVLCEFPLTGKSVVTRPVYVYLTQSHGWARDRQNIEPKAGLLSWP